MKNSFNLKFSILVGILTFTIAIIVGFYSNSISQKQLEINSGESLVKLSKRVNDILDREMLERYREIKFAASLPVMTNEKSTINEKREFIQKIKNNYNHHEWIGYALPDGTVEVGTNGYLEGKNVKARPWHPNGLEAAYIGDVHDALLLAKLLPNNSGEAIYFSDVAFPVINNEGKTLGVLCTHLTWQWTRDVIRGIQRDNDVDIFLLSKDGLILVGPDKTERSNISDISKNVAETFKGNEPLYKTIKWDSESEYLTASSVSLGFEEYKGFSWKVIVRQPVTKAFKIANDNTKSIFYISLIAGILGSLIGIIISNIISSPLKKLSQIVDDLREKLNECYGDTKEVERHLSVTVLSFGFKYGIPSDSDLVFDVRFLPNPYYIDGLREKTGNDPEVQDYVMGNEKAEQFLDKLKDMTEFLIPNYILEGKNQLVISIGCTGGKHRSVTLANALYKVLEKQENYGVRIEHRDIEKDTITKRK